MYEYDKDLERQLFELGLITLPKLTGPTYRDQTQSESLFNLSPSIVGHEDPLLKLLQQQESVRQQLQIKDEEIQKSILSLVQERQEELIKERSTVSLLRTGNRQLQQEVTQGALENQELQRQVEDLRQTVLAHLRTMRSGKCVLRRFQLEKTKFLEEELGGMLPWEHFMERLSPSNVCILISLSRLLWTGYVERSVRWLRFATPILSYLLLLP